MEGTPMELDHEDFEEKLKKVEGVSGLHDLHVWSLGVGKPAMSAHMFIPILILPVSSRKLLKSVEVSEFYIQLSKLKPQQMKKMKILLIVNIISTKTIFI